jgi:hypothetical protein
MPDGSRAIVCRRFEKRPRLDTEQRAIVPPASPWKVGARVAHDRYGAGTIIRRNSEAVAVAFDSGKESAFMLSFVGKAMRVTP